jgi:F-type H+-transporting ATPase subunit c
MVMVGLLLAQVAMATEGEAHGVAAKVDNGLTVFPRDGLIALASALAIGLAALTGTLGQGKAVAAALEGMARNPNAAGKMQTPMIIGLALIESLVIYGLVIAFLLQQKI